MATSQGSHPAIPPVPAVENPHNHTLENCSSPEKKGDGSGRGRGYSLK